MNERKFLKKINSKLNKDGHFTHLEVYDLLQEKQMMLSSKKEHILRKFFTKFRKTKSVEEIISSNFETIMNKTNEQQLELLCEMLIKDEKCRHIVLDNFDKVLDRINASDVTTYTASSIFRNVMKTSNSEEFIEENIDTIIQKTSGENIFEVTQCLKGFSKNIDDKLNETLENQKLDVARYILDSGTICNATNYKKLDNMLLNQYSEKLVLLIDQTLQDEQARMIDISKLGSGSYSKVFQIGEKVLKVGAPRAVAEIPNHPCILQPIKEIEFTDSNNKPISHIEITKKADDLEKEDYQEDKLYELYKSLREDGIIWTDVKFSNVKKIEGKLIVVDRDYIYKEGNPDIIWQDNSYAKSFEKRYLQEKTNNQAQAFKSSIKIQPPIQNIEQGRE